MARSAAVASFVVVALGADCGDPVEPIAPRSVNGSLTLHSTHTDDLGVANGESVVTDATGIPVQLVPADSGAVPPNALTTATQSGRYSFTNVPNGRWRVRVAINPNLPVHSDIVVMSGAGVDVESTLSVPSSPSLLTYPNPFDNTVGVGLERENGPGGNVEFEILTLDFERVWSGELAGNPPGYFHVHWGGVDLEGKPAGLYWAHLRDADGDHYDLVVKGE